MTAKTPKTEERLARYILAVEAHTGKTVIGARIEGRKIYLEFEPPVMGVNPADLVTP